MFYGLSWRPDMNATIRRLRQWPGVAGLVLNLLCWGFIFVAAPTEDPAPFLESSAQEPGGMQFPLRCFDCPAFSVFGKGLGSTWDPIPVKLFLVANWPAIRVARGPEGAWGLAPLNPLILLVVSSLQWLLIGAVWRAWRRSRGKGHSSSVVEA